MKVQFFLVASGSVVLPQLNVALFAFLPSGAIEIAAKYAEALAPAGYFSFNVYDASDEKNQVHLASIKVETPAPVATVTATEPQKA